MRLKARPCLIVSPDEANRYLATAIIAPMTTKGRDYPMRVPCVFQATRDGVVLEQLRTVDKVRLVKRLGRTSPAAQKAVLATLAEMFAECLNPPIADQYVHRQ